MRFPHIVGATSLSTDTTVGHALAALVPLHNEEDEALCVVLDFVASDLNHPYSFESNRMSYIRVQAPPAESNPNLTEPKVFWLHPTAPTEPGLSPIELKPELAGRSPLHRANMQTKRAQIA